jgi:hypothetical protein
MLKRKALIESISANLHSFLKKNSQKFVSSGQKVPARQSHRTSSLRQTSGLPDGTSPAEPEDEVPFATGQARLTPCKE